MIKQRGLTLIEVLVSIFILSVGLLGLAAMQLQSLKYAQGSQWRTHANFLAYDIVERVRANRINADKYVVTNGQPIATGNTLPKKDVDEWLDQLRENIPGGTGSVSWDGGSRTLTVVIQGGDQERTGDAAANMEFTFVTTLEPLNAGAGGGSESASTPTPETP
jgi:type IV pilus assembly protein PilV